MFHKIEPHPALKDLVAYYVYRDSVVESGTIVRPLQARPDPVLGFRLGDPYEVYEYRTVERRVLPAVYIVGPQTSRVADLYLQGRIRLLTVSFQPGGLYRLFGTPPVEIADYAYDAVDVIGPSVRALHEALSNAESVDAVGEMVDAFLMARLASMRPAHPVHAAAGAILRAHGRVVVPSLAETTGLGERQFERRFINEIGARPKLFARIARLKFALRLKEDRPQLTWTRISQEAGYFDHNHLVKDFRALAGGAPSSILQAVVSSRPVFTSEPEIDASAFYYRGHGDALTLTS